MTGKQKIIRWLKYHGGSTLVLFIYLVIAAVGGLELTPMMIVVTFVISATVLIALEFLFWRCIAAIMGWRFIACILHDKWALNKATKAKVKMKH